MDIFGKFRKLDTSLQRGLDNTFARVFGGEVVPTEIDELLKQQAAESVMVNGEGHKLAPSFFIVQVSSKDYDSLLDRHPTLIKDLSTRLGRFIRNRGWMTNDKVTIDLRVADDLHTGQLDTDSRFNIPDSYSPPEADAEAADYDAAGFDDSGDESPEDGSDYGWSDDAADAAGAGAAGAAAFEQAPEPGQAEWPTSTPEPRQAAARDYDADSDSFPAVDSSGFSYQDATGHNGYAEDHPDASAYSAESGLGSIVQPSPGSQDDYASHHMQWEDQADPNQAGYDYDQVGQDQTDYHPRQSVRNPKRAGRDPFAVLAEHQENDSGVHPGMGAYSDEPGDASHGEPGTTVITHAADSVTPVRGGSGQPYGEEEKRTVTLTLQDGSDRHYELQEGSNLIGRGNTVDLRIPDTGVSRQHAEIVWDGFDAVLTDLQSTNGTTVNETPIENWLLADGDVIMIGHSEITVRFH